MIEPLHSGADIVDGKPYRPILTGRRDLFYFFKNTLGVTRNRNGLTHEGIDKTPRGVRTAITVSVPHGNYPSTVPRMNPVIFLETTGVLPLVIVATIGVSAEYSTLAAAIANPTKVAATSLS